MAEFKLSTQLIGHAEDVKGVCGGPMNSVISCSRDRDVKVWENQKTTPPSFSCVGTLTGHQHQVYCVTTLPPSDGHPMGCVVSGSADKTVAVWDLAQNVPVASLSGHQDTVCVLAVTVDGKIVSGSWDKTVRVWSGLGGDNIVLAGHEQAVWGVISLPNGDIVTGSADRTIKMWRDGRCMKTINAHEDAVRQLAVVPNIGFASASNDCLIKVWTLEGECVLTMQGHENFIYSISVLSTGEIVSGSEDKTVKIWRDGTCVQTIAHPNTLWAVAAMESGDIATASSDGIVRVFSRDPARYASEEDLRTFEEFVAASNASNKNSLNMESLLTMEEGLATVGDKDGQVKVFKKGGVAYAHQWSAADNMWHNLGEVTGTAGGGGGGGGAPSGGTIDGKSYDYVFDIDVNGVFYKLGYNIGQDEYMVAANFLETNGLSPTFLSQVAEFIQQNTQQFVLGGAAAAPAVDPFTGARYIPETGPGIHQNFGMAPAGYNPDPFTGSNAPGRSEPAVSHFPLKTPCLFETGKVEGAIKKSREFVASAAIARLEAVANGIPGKSALGDGDLVFLAETAQSLESAKRFPVVDICRLAVLSPGAKGQLLGEAGAAVTALVESNCRADAATNARMLTLRLVANCFAHRPEAAPMLQAWAPSTFDCGTIVLDSSNDNEKLAFVTCIMNYSMISKDLAEDLVMQGLMTMCEIISSAEKYQPELIYRTLVAIGTFLAHRKDLTAETLSSLDAKPTLVAMSSGSGADARITACAGRLVACL